MKRGSDYHEATRQKEFHSRGPSGGPRTREKKQREEAEKAPGVKSRRGKLVASAIRGVGRNGTFLPEYGSRGGTGGQNGLPTESLSRLQLLGVGLTDMENISNTA